jgi:hypothetical protein
MGQWRGKYPDTGPPRGPGHPAIDWDTTPDAYEQAQRSA